MPVEAAGLGTTFVHVSAHGEAHVANVHEWVRRLNQFKREQLSAAFRQVGMMPSEEAINEVLAQLSNKLSPAEVYTFAEFARAADLLSPVE